jgi:hypothetical protein
VFAPETGEVFVLLLTFAHPGLAVPIRVCNAGDSVYSGGLEFVHFPFEFELPPENDQAPPTVRLRICNVDRRIVEAVRTVGSPPTVTVTLVMASTPDQVEAGPFEFTMRDATFDAIVVEGGLAYQDLLSEPFPADAFTPTRTPGIF